MFPLAHAGDVFLRFVPEVHFYSSQIFGGNRQMLCRPFISLVWIGVRGCPLDATWPGRLFLARGVRKENACVKARGGSILDVAGRFGLCFLF